MSRKHSGAWRGKRTPEDARKFLDSCGFTTFVNERAGCLVVRLSEGLFVIEAVSLAKAQEFVRWIRANKGRFRAKKGRLAPAVKLPSGIRLMGQAKAHENQPTIPVQKPRTKSPVRQPLSGMSIAIEGSHSTVPGHFADLDWNDLRKR